MSDRLQELLQQRALLQSHLAWLDREIAAASGSTPSVSHSLPVPDTLGANAAPTALSSRAAPNIPLAQSGNAEEILAQYRQETGSLQTDVRKGCLLYFFGAFLLLGLVLVVFYFLNTRLHRLDSQAPPESLTAPAGR